MEITMRKYTDLLQAVSDFEPWGVIFDMDGLILDTERVFMEQLAVAMAEEGYRLSREVYCKSLGMSGKNLENLMLSEYGVDYPFYDMGKKARERVDMIAATVGLQIKPQIPELLAALYKKGVKCVVASSTHSDTVNRYLSDAGIRKYFSVIVGGEMVEHSKPQPDIFFLACQKSGLKPSQALVLEDSENGVRAAAAAGIPVICVPDLKMPEQEICQMASAIVVSRHLSS
jgi:HAD superfamily hydrolase (TIGR01509 family)